ncbi:MAG: hypothetical protein C4293_10335, partial [Nitrospiraceae bacterium]
MTPSFPLLYLPYRFEQLPLMLSRHLARSERYYQDSAVLRDRQIRKNRACLKSGLVLSLYALLGIFVSATVWVRVHYEIPAAPPLIEKIPIAEEDKCSDS